MNAIINGGGVWQTGRAVVNGDMRGTYREHHHVLVVVLVLVFSGDGGGGGGT